MFLAFFVRKKTDWMSYVVLNCSYCKELLYPLGILTLDTYDQGNYCPIASHNGNIA